MWLILMIPLSLTGQSWGNILHFAFFRNSILRGQVWWYLPPIICICVAVMGFMLVGYYGQQKKD